MEVGDVCWREFLLYPDSIPTVSSLYPDCIPTVYSLYPHCIYSTKGGGGGGRRRGRKRRKMLKNASIIILNFQNAIRVYAFMSSMSMTQCHKFKQSFDCGM